LNFQKSGKILPASSGAEYDLLKHLSQHELRISVFLFGLDITNEGGIYYKSKAESAFTQKIDWRFHSGEVEKWLYQPDSREAEI